MAKKTAFQCLSCGELSDRDDPFCARCGADYPWERSFEADRRGASSPVLLSDVAPTDMDRVDVGGLNAAFGGGFPRGASLVVSGMPGAGKSSLCLVLAAAFEQAGGESLYISDEMPLGLLRAMSDRVAPGIRRMRAWERPSVADVCADITKTRPALVVVDSLQRSSEAAGDAIAAYLDASRVSGASVVFIAHAVKTGDVAGAIADQHDVDIVGWIVRDEQGARLQVRKNRFGPAPVEACFR